MSGQLRTAIVTGGSSGIGFATASAFVDRGYNVVIGGRDQANLDTAVRALGGSVRAVRGDIGTPGTGADLVTAAVEAFGGVDVLVNNAGIFGSKPFAEVTGADLDEYLAGNLRGTYLVTQAVARWMIDQGTPGSIVNVTTVLLSQSIGGFQASAALVSKGGVRALTLALAAELAQYRIRVNEVAPGIVRTRLHGASGGDEMRSLAVLRRIADPAEIAASIVHLAESENLSGTVLNSDGGYVTVRP